MFGLLIPYARQIGIAVVALLLLIGSYFLGYSHEKAKLEAYVAQVEAVGKTQEEKNKQVLKTQDRINSEAANVYKANLAAVKSYYSNGLHIGTRSSSMPQVPSSTPGADVSPSYPILTGQCAETTAQLIGLQKWVKDQGSIE